MDLLSNLSLGFSEISSWGTLLYCLIGVTVGTFVGVLPGLGATASMAILLPLTTGMPVLDAIVLLAGVFYGSMYGSSITSILINTPGQPASVPVLKDGYAMAKAGRAGPALVMTALGSFVGGTISIIALTLFAPMLAKVTIYIGPPEYFAVLLAAITMVLSLAGRNMAKALVSALLGFAIFAVGIDEISGMPRLTFGQDALLAGIDFIPVLIGIYAISEIFVNMERRGQNVYESIRKLYPSWQEIKYISRSLLRGGSLGTMIGVVPGASAATASFMAYEIEYRIAKDKSKFGKGETRGISSAEAANNGATGGAMVPLLTLGIPADPAIAVLLGAMIIQGAQPGPLFFSDRPELAWGIIASLYIGNVLLLFLNVPLVGLWARIVKIPYPILAVSVLSICVVGAYGVRNNMFDVWTMFAFGIIGYLMRKAAVPAEPLVLTMILAPIMSPALIQSLAMSGGDVSIFVTRPFSAAFLALAVVLVFVNLRSRQKTRLQEEPALEGKV